MDNQLQQVLADLIKQLGHAATTYGPQAIDMAGQYLQMKAIFTLVSYGIGLIVAGVVAGLLYKALRFTIGKHNVECDYGDHDWGFLSLLLGVLVGLPFLLYFGFLLASLCDPTIWLPALSPKMALVQQALSAVGGSR